jgi:hypothetical protein
MEDEGFKFIITVLAEDVGRGKTHIDIAVPPEYRHHSPETAIRVLCSGFGLLIKGAHKMGFAKDFELVETAIDHIKSEFISNECFADVKPSIKKDDENS